MNQFYINTLSHILINYLLKISNLHQTIIININNHSTIQSIPFAIRSIMIIVQKLNQTLGKDYTAYIVMLLANLVYTVGLMIGAESQYGNVFYIAVVRGIITIISSYILAKAYGYPLDIRNSSDIKIIIIRGAITGFQQIIMGYAFYYLPPSLVHTITNIGPILVFVIDYFKNHVSVSKRQIMGVFVSSVGLIVAVNSLIIMHYLGYQSFAQNSKYPYHQSTLGFKVFIAAILFIEFIFWAYAMIITKDLKQTNPIQLNFTSGLIYIWIGTLFTFPYQNTRLVTSYQLLWDILFIGGPITLATLLYMWGLTLTKKTGNLTITNFSTVIIGYIISILRYGEKPDFIGILGSILIFVGMVLVLVKKQSQPKI